MFQSKEKELQLKEEQLGNVINQEEKVIAKTKSSRFRFKIRSLEEEETFERGGGGDKSEKTK